MGRKKMATAESRYYRLDMERRVELRDGSTKIRLHAEDRYDKRRYAIERRAVVLLNHLLDRYLKKRPQLAHESRENIARKLVYLIPGIRAWSVYMPGGFATHHVHNPNRQVLQNGKKLDWVTRALFRHSYDGRGLRSRAYAMAWFIANHAPAQTELDWVSVGCGTGQPTFDAATALQQPVRLTLLDSNKEIVAFAQQLAHEYAIPAKRLATQVVDVTNDQQLAAALAALSPQVIDAMGLFEYLSDRQATAVLARLYAALEPGGVLTLTNMLPSHPHLDLHQRGLGWPGVVQRSLSDMRHIIKSAGIAADKLTVMLPDDGVYAIYGVVK